MALNLGSHGIFGTLIQIFPNQIHAKNYHCRPKPGEGIAMQIVKEGVAAPCILTVEWHFCDGIFGFLE